MSFCLQHRSYVLMYLLSVLAMDLQCHMNIPAVLHVAAAVDASASASTSTSKTNRNRCHYNRSHHNHHSGSRSTLLQQERTLPNHKTPYIPTSRNAFRVKRKSQSSQSSTSINPVLFLTLPPLSSVSSSSSFLQNQKQQPQKHQKQRQKYRRVVISDNRRRLCSSASRATLFMTTATTTQSSTFGTGDTNSIDQSNNNNNDVNRNSYNNVNNIENLEPQEYEQKQERQKNLYHNNDLSHAEISRYSRHLVLEDVGVRGQKRLKESSVLVIGAGGLGSPVLLYLAAAGVGHIGIVDSDIVDESNLQRQIIHGSTTIGISKCKSAAKRISDINPFVHVQLHEKEFTSETAIDIVSNGFIIRNDEDNDDNENDYSSETNKQQQRQQQQQKKRRPWDVIVDGSDNFPTKYLINDVCAIYNIPWVYSAILGFEGQVSVFNYNTYESNNNDDSVITKYGPDYRDLLPIPPPPGDVPSCAEGGVLGVLPGTMGCIQATETIKLLLYGENNRKQQSEQQQHNRDNLIKNTHDKVDILSGRVLVFDALKMKFSTIQLRRDMESRRIPITTLIDYQGFCNNGRPSSISPALSSSSLITDLSNPELHAPTITQQQQQQQQQQEKENYPQQGHHYFSSSMVPPASSSNAENIAGNNNNDGSNAPISPQGVRTMDEAEPVTPESMSSSFLFHSIGPKECFHKLVHCGWTPYVVDVRLQTEHDIVSLPFTDSVVPYRTIHIHKDTPPSGDILVYCKGGVRGKKACQSLIEQGIEPHRLYNLDGGIMKWQHDIDPSMPRY